MNNLYRYVLYIEYDGTHYAGFQAQQGHKTIQCTIEMALQKFIKPIARIVAAGRTDAGVHAIRQVAHCDTATFINPLEMQCALNAYLRDEKIAIIHCELKDNNFHARFSAIARSYRYIIVNRYPKIVLMQNRAWHIRNILNIEAMIEASKLLIGTHDFSSFRASECQAKSAIKTINIFDIHKRDEQIFLEIEAPSFLHHQVRNIVGSLSLVGLMKWTIEDFLYVLKARDRKIAGPTAPAHGLYLIGVKY